MNRRNMTRALAIVTIIGTACSASPALALTLSETPTPGWPSFNSTIWAFAEDPVNDILYVGGDFTRVNASGKDIALIDLTTGEADASWPTGDNGTYTGVFEAIPDGEGGAFVSGSFLDIGGTGQRYVAHILSDGSVDPAFRPVVDGSIGSIALSPDGETLYLTGYFFNVNGVPRNYAAAVSTADGSTTAFNPDMNGHGLLVFVSPDGDDVYVGGFQSTVNGGAAARQSLASFASASGQVNLAFDAGISGWYSQVSSMVFNADESVLYIAGMFTTVHGASRNHIAAINPTTGEELPFDPSIGDMYSSVSEIELNADESLLYAVGPFTTVNTSTTPVTRNFAAAFDASTGTVDPTYNPNASYVIYEQAFSDDGDTIYLGGAFESINGGAYSRHNFAEVSAITGVATSLIIPVSYDTSDDIRLVRLFDATHVVLGGMFSSAGGVTRNRLAAIDTTTGTLTEFDPNINGTVYDLALSSDGSTLYAGGQFSTVNNSVYRQYIAGFDTDTADATDFEPSPNSIVYDIALSSDDATLYAGGNFSYIGGADRYYLGAVSTATGTATAFNPQPNNPVFALKLTSDDSTLYAGGQFRSLGGSQRSNFGSVDTASGVATAFNPDVDSAVIDIAIAPDEKAVFAAGDFTDVNMKSTCDATYDADPNTVYGRASYDPATDRFGIAQTVSLGSSNGWTDTIPGESAALTREPVSGAYAYLRSSIPGHFMFYNSMCTPTATFTSTEAWVYTGNHVCVKSTVTGRYYNLYVTTASNGEVYYSSCTVRNYLASFRAEDGSVTEFDPDVSGSGYAIGVSAGGGTTAAGGYFSSVNDGGASRYRLAAFRSDTGEVNPADMENADLVDVVLFSENDDALYVGRNYTTGGNTFARFAVTDKDPVITLIGDAAVTVTKNSTYTDAGATASDPEDGNLTGDIVTDNPVDTAVAGTYTVTYTVEDSSGNTGSATRTVTVRDGGGGGGGSGYTHTSYPDETPTPTPTPSVTPTATPVPGAHAKPEDFQLKEGDPISAHNQAGDPDIFIVNNWGYKRLFLNPIIFSFYAHLGGFTSVKQVAPGARDAFITSGLFQNCETQDPKVYAVEVTAEDDAVLHHVELAADAALAQDPDFFKKVFCMNTKEFNWYTKSLTPYTSLAQVPVYSRR